MTLRKWKTENKRGYEDLLLLEYWREVGGLILQRLQSAEGELSNGPKVLSRGALMLYAFCQRRAHIQVTTSLLSTRKAVRTTRTISSPARTWK